MIIYGSRSSEVKRTRLDSESCPHCGTKGSLQLFTLARYAHIFWIPAFSLGRSSVSHCEHCKQVLETKQMPAQIRAYHERNLAETRIPLWQFSGLALLMVAIVFGVYANGLDKDNQKQYLQNPIAGDVYEFKVGPSAYSTFRITEVHTDTLVVNFNNYETDRISGLYKIDKEENYSDSTYYLTSARLKEMFDSGEIMDINRY